MFFIKIIQSYHSYILVNSYKNRIANITDSEPIVVNKYKRTSYYQIQDGRHRFAQAILNGSDTVNVTII